MPHFEQVLPKETFVTGKNIKLYPGSLPEELLATLNNDIELPAEQVYDSGFDAELGVHMYVRHLESMYNRYKKEYKQMPLYQEFMATENPVVKEKLYMELLHDFVKKVNIDSMTDLSDYGNQHGEQLAKFYAEFFAEHPELFPEIVFVSPYLRTRKTAHYILQNVAGLDLDIDQLLKNPEESAHTGMIVGSYNGHDVVMQMNDNIRERDHGNIDAPWFYKREMQRSQNEISSLLSDEQYDQEHYFKTLKGGESQVTTSRRAKQHLNTLAGDHRKRSLSVTHHLVKVGTIETIMGGGIYNFYNFDNNRKPENGSLSLITGVSKTQTGQQSKLRVGAYNLLPQLENQ